MNNQILKVVFSNYEILKDSIKVARRSINNELYQLHNRTVFLGEQKNQMLDRISDVETELDDIMILSLFASFERELRISIQSTIDSHANKPNPTLHRLIALTTESIERWTVSDMIDALSDVVAENIRGRVKQIYEYRNWVAHGKNQARVPSIRTDPKTVQITLLDFILQANNAI